MLGAIGIHIAIFRRILSRDSPLFTGRFQLPTHSDIDVPLIGGSTMFGLGWGLSGYCLGPALVSVSSHTNSTRYRRRPCGRCSDWPGWRRGWRFGSHAR